jgi:hypothetical protein
VGSASDLRTVWSGGSAIRLWDGWMWDPCLLFSANGVSVAVQGGDQLESQKDKWTYKMEGDVERGGEMWKRR